MLSEWSAAGLNVATAVKRGLYTVLDILPTPAPALPRLSRLSLLGGDSQTSLFGFLFLSLTGISQLP